MESSKKGKIVMLNKQTKIYAMSDTHLALESGDKDHMTKFGLMWKNHVDKIKISCESWISDEDILLIPGDISWATSLEKAKKDLNFIKGLPGYKIIVKGNHDFWWQSLNKVKEYFEDEKCFTIQNNGIVVENIGIAGTRGWTCPGSSYFTVNDQKIYDREVERLKRSLDSLPKDIEYKIVMLHYPPTNEFLDRSGFTELLETYNVNKCVFGHLHKNESRLTGNVRGVDYYLCSCDSSTYYSQGAQMISLYLCLI